MIAEGEVGRLKELPKDFDNTLFNKFYKQMTPLIRNLVRNIDHRRFNVSPDIIRSYFYDKLLYVYCKYHHLLKENPEKFKATLISSLQTFKYRTLRNAYSKQSEYYQQLEKLDDCFEGDRELLPDVEEEDIYYNDRLEELLDWVKSHCSADAYLLFQVELNPPPYFIGRSQKLNKLNTRELLEFFGKPITNPYIELISSLRKEVKISLEQLQVIHNK